jgi:hypothetical protein
MLTILASSQNWEKRNASMIMNIKKNQNMGFFDFLNMKKNINVIKKIKE